MTTTETTVMDQHSTCDLAGPSPYQNNLLCYAGPRNPEPTMNPKPDIGPILRVCFGTLVMRPVPPAAIAPRVVALVLWVHYRLLSRAFGLQNV